MKKVLAILLFTTSFAYADNGIYIGAGVTGTSISGDGIDVGVAAAMVRVGYEFSDYLAIETRLNGTSSTDTVYLQGTPVDFSIDSQVSMYARLTPNTSWKVRPYLLAGWTTAEATANACYNGRCASITQTESGFSYGAGAIWDITANLALTGDWTAGIEDTTQFTGGINFKF